MKRIAIINGGDYTQFLCEAVNPRHYEITEWDVMPIVGDYHLVLFFLEGAVRDGSASSVRDMKRRFMKYVKQYPCKWVMFAPQTNLYIRKKGVMKNHNRAILDACRFGFQFKKRFRCWSSFPITSVLCNRNCVMARATPLHDPLTWKDRGCEPMAKRQIELYKAYDKINIIPLDLIRHIIELSIRTENTFPLVEYEFKEQWE